MKTTEPMEIHMPREFERIMRSAVGLDMERFVYSLQDICDSVVAIKDNSLYYYGGLHTGYGMGYLTNDNLDCIFANLGRFRNLKSITIEKTSGDRRPFMSRWSHSLESVAISGEYDSTPLNNFPKLRELSIIRFDADIAVHAPIAKQLTALSFCNLLDESAMSHFSNLETLTCGKWVGEFKPLSAKLKRLFIENLKRTSLDGLPCTGLESLRVQSDSLSDISALGAFKHLRSVEIISSVYVDSIAPLADKPIENLILPKSSVLDFSPLSTMSELKRLYINDSLITDLSCLEKLDKLEYLDIWGCSAIEDYTPLLALPNLREVRADSQSVLKFPDELLKKLNMERPNPYPPFAAPHHIPNRLQNMHN